MCAGWRGLICPRLNCYFPSLFCFAFSVALWVNKYIFIDIINFVKHFLSFTRHSDLIVKYNIGLKTLQHQGISELELYDGLIYNSGSGLRFNDGSDVKLSSIGWCLLLVFDLPPLLNLRFPLALSICESWAFFFVSS